MVSDFSGSSPQAAGSIKLIYPALLTAARCMFKAVTNADIPVNGGCFRPLEVRCEPGTIVSATRPAPVSIYYDAFQAAMDVIAMALAPLVPDRLPAGHQRRSEEHPSELQSLMRHSYAVFFLKKNKTTHLNQT